MADSSKTVTPEQQAGSSKLDLPTTQKRGSSITAKSKQPSQTEPKSAPTDPITEQPTAISNQPPIDLVVPTTSTRVPAKVLLGKDLLHFHVEEFVGGGGMGAVFRGRDNTLGRTVAVKVLSQEHIDDDMIRRFRHEAESAAKLDHPGIPHVYYVGEQDGWYFIVFEFIEGQNIRDYVAEQGPLSIPQTIVYLADIADALQHASIREVVHRDIKPSNVLITNDGEAKLVDMGLARTEHIQSTANDLTATGVTLGTFDYISPEQGRDPRNVDTRSDIYSLGCTLYFMLTGRPPFPDGTMLQKLLSHTSDAPPDPSEFRDDISPRLTELLARMLAKLPEHRHQDAGELLGEILLLADEQNVTINGHSGANIVIERNVIQETGFRRHIPWLIPLLVLVATAIGLQSWTVKPTPAPMIDGSVAPDIPDANSPVVQDTPSERNADTRSIELELPHDGAESDRQGYGFPNEDDEPNRPETS